MAPPRARISITAQSQRPKTRANVRSSVALGSGQSPGCVWIQSGRTPLAAAPRGDLILEVMGDRQILEGDRDRGRHLRDKDHVLDPQQVVRGADPEPTDFGLTPDHAASGSLAHAGGVNRGGGRGEIAESAGWRERERRFVP